MEISDRLGKLATFYHRRACKCSRARAYFAASVMQGAALEAALQAMCFLYPNEVKKTTVYQRKKFEGKRNKALEFNLYQLIKIAEELAWFPPKCVTWAGKRKTLAGFSHEVRELRNFVDPGKWAREHPDTTKFTKYAYDAVYEVFDVATGWLLHRVHDGERYRNGEKIASGFVESAINQVVSKRMLKKQQMGWSQRGAHLLLQIRTRVLDQEWENTFRRWYPDFRPQGQAKKAA
jgi:hypothetical protein